MDRDFTKQDGKWFPIMNELAEKLMQYDLTKIESRVLWMFFRHCYGWKSSTCELRWKDMRNLTGLGDGSLSKAINGLKDRNILNASHTESKRNITYKINSKLSTWKPILHIRKDFTNVKQTLHKREVNTSHTESPTLLKTIKDTSKDNNVKGQKTTFDPTSLPYQLSETLLSRITKNIPDFKPSQNGVRDATLQRWSIDIDKMIRIDNRKPCNIWNMILWIQDTDTDTGEFWFKNILSGAKLRKQYDKLSASITAEIRKKERNKPQHDRLMEVGRKWLEKQKNEMNDF